MSGPSALLHKLAMRAGERKAIRAYDRQRREYVAWAYRLLLGREPESEAVLDEKVRNCQSRTDLLATILYSEEFCQVAEFGFPAGTDVLVELEPGLRMWVDLSCRYIGQNIARGNYERSEIDFARASVSPGTVALDIGANMGLFSVHLAQQVGAAGHVHAFEPMPWLADLVWRSLRENGFEQRATLHRGVVSDQVGAAEVVFPSQSINSGGAYLRPDQHAVMAGHATEAVQSYRLDDLELGEVSFIKIDVEGAEPMALAGGRELLASQRPTILSELHPEQLERVSATTPREFIGWMGELGYACHSLVDGKPGDRLNDCDRLVSAVFLPR